MTTENKKTIYESPDGGKTVYARLEGSSERNLHKEYIDENVFRRKERFLKWKKILSEAENNQPLQDLLDQAEALYELIRNRE